MTLQELITAFRQRTQDLQPDYLWSDIEIAGYADDAVNEACERASLIEDSITPSVCLVTLAAGTSDYALHPSILSIKRASFQGRVLQETSAEEMDACHPGWELQQNSLPRRFIFTQGASLRLTPTPAQAGAIALTVFRTPIYPLTINNIQNHITIPARMHNRLLDWMLYLGYSKPDSEVLDMKRANASEARFTASFGARVDANVQRKQRDKAPPVVQFQW